MKNLVGQTIADRYHVQEFLGRGGMAEVYKVWDQQRSVFLAMKLLSKDLARDRVFMRRFKREAENLSKLQHPNIVRFYSLEQEHLLAFMLMDFIEGDDLKTLIFLNPDGVSFQQTLELMRTVLGGVQFAHNLGLIHCDIKPGNIMINRHGEALLADFGISRMADAATATMVGAGTPAYMAPEIIKGLDPVPQSDIYSLGILLYEMLTGGERPFTGELATSTGSTGEKVRWEQINLKPPSPRKYRPEISKELEAVVFKCLEKDPKKRYASALDLLNALETALGGENKEASEDEEMTVVEGIEAPAIKPPTVEEAETVLEDEPKVVEPGRNTPTGLLIGIGAVVIVVVGLIILFSGNGRTVINENDIENAVPIQIETETPTVTPTKTATVTPTQTGTAIPTTTFTPTSTPIGGGGGKIAFSSNRDGDSEIYVMNVDGSHVVRLTDNDRVDYSPDWSPDGSRIAFTSNRDGNTEIYVMDADGSNVVRRTENGTSDFYPNWSPDGSQINFSSYRDGNSEIYVMDVDGSNAVRLTYNDVIDSSPNWSPDGRQIVFVSNRNGNNDIYVMDADGSNVVRLTYNEEDDYAPNWSPDGRRIVFYSGRGSYYYEIFVMDADGSNVFRLTDNNVNDLDPVWSPDGRKIAFISSRDWNYEIYVMDADGSNVLRLTDNDLDDSSPVWQP